MGTLLLASEMSVPIPRNRTVERPRRDTNGGSETEVTVTSKLQANAERNKEIEKRKKREEKDASFGGVVRDSVPEDELSGGGARHSDAESEGGRRPECPGSRIVRTQGREKVGFIENTAMRHRWGG